jgi:GntR family transcriptional regulator, transcriptional repressor for pyruvate dehydrogenase complex
MDGPSTKPVVVRLMEWIAERRLQPGDRLPSERELATRLGCGRNAVREAIAMMTSLRIVESKPQSGIYLREFRRQASFEALVMLSQLGRPPTTNEISEAMEVRAVLERTAIELACARRDDKDLAALDRVLLETEAIIGENGNIVDADTAFHLTLASASHNVILVRVLNAFYELTAARRRPYFARPQRAKASHRQHKQIVEAVKARDVALGVKLINEHVARARSYWRLNLPAS